MINIDVYHKNTLVNVEDVEVFCDDFAGFGILDTGDAYAYDSSGIIHRIDIYKYDVSVSISSFCKTYDEQIEESILKGI